MTGDAIFRRAANGNQAAYQFLVDITEVAHFWDDLVDGDKSPFTPFGIHTHMKKALIDLPRNPFYQANFQSIMTLMEAAVQNWLTANELESYTNPELRHIAFITRSSYVDLVIYTARVCGADVSEISMEVRKLVHSEGYEQYLRTLEVA